MTIILATSQVKVNRFFMTVILPEFCFFTSSSYNEIKSMNLSDEAIIIAGLGNPGSKYDGTRHNAGFEVLDLFAKENDFPPFSSPKRSKFEVSKGAVNERKIFLIKPLTFMNLSGFAIKEAIAKLGLKSHRLMIIHDDIDIPIGKVKVSKNRGPGGHKGVVSIIKELGTKDFVRIRIGILPERKPDQVDTFVLKRPPEDQRAKLQEAMKIAISEIEKEIRMEKAE